MEDERPPQKDGTAVFIEQIAKADGSLIPLPTRVSKLNEPFYISVRYGADAIQEEYRYLIVDVFVQRDGEFVPVGIYDWEITGETAVGNKQRHGHLDSLNQAHEAADRYWATGEAFHVVDMNFLSYASSQGGLEGMTKFREAGVIKDEDQWAEPIYQGEGLGGLMIAVSALALHRQGIKEMDLGRLSPKAKGVWRKFDRGERQIIPTEELVDHPKTIEAIEKFVA